MRTLVGPGPGAGTEDDNVEFLGEARFEINLASSKGRHELAQMWSQYQQHLNSTLSYQ
jgi:hypothetical protein